VQGHFSFSYHGVHIKGVLMLLGLKVGLPSHFGHFVIALSHNLGSEYLQSIHVATSNEFDTFFDA
jgi:hypothetical protein